MKIILKKRYLTLVLYELSDIILSIIHHLISVYTKLNFIGDNILEKEKIFWYEYYLLIEYNLFIISILLTFYNLIQKLF